MQIITAAEPHLPDLARLIWEFSSEDERAAQGAAEFVGEVGAWWAAHRRTHVALLALEQGGTPVGTAWVALLPRTPRPGRGQRLSAEIQTLFVRPGHRGRGTGSALIAAALEHAAAAGAHRVTVASSTLAVPLYTRLGFTPSELSSELSVELSVELSSGPLEAVRTRPGTSPPGGQESTSPSR